MIHFRLTGIAIAGFAVLCAAGLTSRAADVTGYSILKGQFLLQTDAEELHLDPDFGFSFLASVDLSDFDLGTNASVRLPNGTIEEMDNLGDYWAYLDTNETWAGLNQTYGWGGYSLEFATVNEGPFTCPLNFVNTALPPIPLLLNYTNMQSVNPARPLLVQWDFSADPKAGDFVQVYISRGHDDVFSTPNYGEPGALSSSSRSVEVPRNILEFNGVYSLNLEITRPAATNAISYPAAEGIAATFSSTEIDLFTIIPPRLRVPSAPVDGILPLEVWGEPGATNILQGSYNWATWLDLATNSAASGTNVFSVPFGPQPAQFFRVLQP